MSIHAAIRLRLVAIVAAFVLILSGFLAAQPALADSAPLDPTNPATPTTVTDDVLPTPQINGVVWQQTVVGNTVYVVGSFTNARPYGSAPGVNTVTRNNILAYDITTGNLITSFAPSLNAQALAVTASPDGSRIYVGGDFTSVDGKGYYRVAAFSTATGAIIPSFRPIMQSEIRALAATNSTVYAGGYSTTTNGLPRTYLSAINAADGSTLPWTANADAPVYALTLTADGSKLIVGGQFHTLSGVTSYGLGAVDPTTGASLPWAVNQAVQDYGTNSAITSLYATSDRVYGSGYVWTNSTGNLEGTFSADPNTGAINWINDCHGDTYSVFATESVVYDVGHTHYCGNIGGFPQTSPTWTFHYTLAFSKAATGTITPDPYGYHNWAGNPSPSLLDFYPNYTIGTYTGQSQATWSVSGNSQYLVTGGEFMSVNGIAQQGLTRFAVSSIAPNKVGPAGIPLVPAAASFNAGQVRVGWTATYDADNGYLTYKVYRDSGTTPVYQVTQHSNFYTRPAMGFIDTGLVPGSTHIYHVKVSDPFGNTVSRDTPSVTVASQNSGGAYASSVTTAGASSYWPLDEASGTAGFDHIGFNDLQVQGGVTRGAVGPVSGVAATTFNGTSTGFAVTPTAIAGPNTFTAQAWIRTTSTSGGKIIGFGNSNTGTSSSYDRQVYMDNSGKIWFGVYPGGVATVNSSASYNDGQWHEVVASLGANGMQLYVDGKQVAARTDVTSGQAYNGFWRVGGDNLNGWTSQPSSNFFAGDIGQVAIYPTVLNRTTIANQYVASGRANPLPVAPADAYGAAVFNDNPDIYWRLGDSSPTTATDSGPLQNNGTYSGAVTTGTPGVLNGVANTAATFTATQKGNGWSGGTVVSNTQVSNPTTYSLELWFKTTTTTGGKLIGFGDQQSGLSSNYDRHVYMQNNGDLVFGTWTGQANTITTPTAYNDGQWHYVVATQASDGMKLYVDGALAGTNGQTAAQAYNGYWRIGGDNTWGSTSPYFTGTLDEAAVYSSELSAQDVANHYSLGTTGALPNQPPVASFTSSVTNLTAAFDATASSDPDGTVASYAWNFGDGTTGTGATTTHGYFPGGTYNVTLTVTDNQGATSSVSHTVAVTAPPANQPPVASFTTSTSNLVANVDATASSDPDGTIAGYAWNFGDGTTGTGVTATHTYTAAGSYPIELTVTDNQGATTSLTKTVTVTAPPVNQPPTAAFTSTVSNLAVAFDGSGSNDPDGTVASYAWDFGDGTTGTGVTTSHTYATAGTFTATLTVTDNQGATGVVTHQVTTIAPPNQPPTAAFTSSAAGLVLSVDGSTSSDPDGTIAGYAWNFGDGSTGTGATTSHTYSAAGTYTVTLTVTDNGGATNAKSASVTVTAPVANAIAQDGFARTTANGWGSADIGGAWTLSGGAANFLTTSGYGQQSAAAGATLTAKLAGVSVTSADVLTTVTTDKAATGGGAFLSAIGRLVGSTDYSARVWIKSTGQVQLQLMQSSTTLSAINIANLTYTAGTALNVRVQVFGTSPTTIRAKVWPASQTEPTAWQLSTTDSTAALQVAGAVGLRTYLSGLATDIPVAVRFSNFITVAAQ